MPQVLILNLLCSLLIGLDLYLSYKRMKLYGPEVELNPIVRSVARSEGISASIATLLVLNLFLLAIVGRFSILLAMFTGAKLALAALQIRSLQLEHSNSSKS